MGAGSSSSDDFVHQYEMLRRLLDEAGRDPATFAISKRVYLAVDDHRDRAERRLREWFAARYRSADMAPRVSIWGSRAECIDKLAELVRAGARHLMLNPVFDELEHLELLARDVMPHL
jgi:alkanesulfonate monooxygenase SsuD/methylene tetrahydromethanopterin reductase-like flavin-dependent oxidoreductase (luciferase family)